MRADLSPDQKTAIRRRVAANSLRQYHEFMNLGFPEMIFIFLLALIIFGPRKLPEIGRQIGKAMNEFKKASNEFKSQIEGEMRNLELEELAKREPAPQILPPENTVPLASPDETPEIPDTPHSASSADAVA